MSPAERTAVSYIRVSTKEQAQRDGDPEGYSIPAQREANARKAESLGAVIVEVFADRGESARSVDRPELQRMLHYITEHQVDYVIVHKVDRLARNRRDDVEINLALHQAGAKLVSATENIDETPSGMLLHGIMSTIAEFYSRNLANEVIKGMSQKAKSGGTPGKAPIGYRNIRTVSPEGRELRTVEVDPLRGPLIAWAFEAYATGSWTPRALAAELEARGLTSLPSPQRPGRPLGPNHLHRVLSNPYYKGLVRWRGAEVEGKHVRLVSEAIWAQVQVALGSHAAGEKTRQHPHYLKSSVYCGDCGSRLIVTHATNRHGATYPYFVCLGRHQKTTTCTRKAMLISDVEKLVERQYATVQIDAQTRAALERVVMAEMEAFDESNRKLDRQLILQQQRLINERAKLLQAHYAGAIALDLLKSEQDRIATQLAVIEERQRSAAVAVEVIRENLTSALDLIEDCERAYREAGPLVRRLFNQAFFTRLYIDEDGVRAELAEPFDTLLGSAVLDEVRRREFGQVVGPAASPERQAALRVVQGGRPPRAAEASNRRSRRVSCLNDVLLVPPAGFEPALPA